MGKDWREMECRRVKVTFWLLVEWIFFKDCPPNNNNNPVIQNCNAIIFRLGRWPRVQDQNLEQ